MVAYVFQNKAEFVGCLKGLAAKAEGRAEAKTGTDRAHLQGQALAYRDIADMLETTFFKDVDALKTT